MEITRLYDLTNLGKYTVSAEITGLDLTAKENITKSHSVKYIDKAAVKQANGVNSDVVQFVIVQ
jgi:hypothetical protein